MRCQIVVEPPLHGLRHPTAAQLRAVARAKTAQLRGRPRDGASAFYRWAGSRGTHGNAFDEAPPQEREALLAHAPVVLAELDLHPFGVMFEHLPLRRVRRMQVPITYLLGEDSAPFFHRLHRRLVGKVPGIRTEVIPGASHLVHIDAPEAFAAAVDTALSAGQGQD